MSFCVTRLAFRQLRHLRCNALARRLPKPSRLNIINRRCIADRSFRLANVGDLAVAQEFKDQIAPEHYVTFVHTADVVKRDLDKQIVMDLSHEQGYKRGHIKGAINLPLEKFDFCRVIEQYGGIHQDEVYQVFKSLGVSNDTSEIILYYGFQNVRILNGGWRSWLRAGLPVDEQETVPVPAKTLDLKPKRDGIVTKPTQMVFDHEHKTSQIVDTRRPDAYQEYHIPRAINIPSKLFMQDGEFISVKAIRDILQSKDLNLEDKHTIIYSSKGLTSAVAFFCMTMAGVDRVSVYDQGIYNWIQNFESKISPDIAEHLQR